MIHASDPHAAVVKTLIDRHGALESQISALRWRREGDDVAGAATFASVSGAEFFATVGLREGTARSWLSLGSAVSPLGPMTDRVWVCNGAWTTTGAGDGTSVSIIGGMANQELVASAVVQDERGISAVDIVEHGMVVFLSDPLDLKTARVLLRDAGDSVVWEGPLLNT